MGVLSTAFARIMRQINAAEANPVTAMKRGMTLLDNNFREDRDPRMIMNFADKENFLKFGVKTDADIRGKSTASISYNDETKTGVFEGVLDLTVDDEAARVAMLTKSGYAAIRFPGFAKPMDLQQYDCFRIRAKGDGRVYVLNIVPFERYMEEEWRMFQVPLVTKAGVWQTTTIPFGALMSSYRGKIDENHGLYFGQEVLSVGILMAQRQAGPFRLELDWLKAINRKDEIARSRYDPAYKR